MRLAHLRCKPTQQVHSRFSGWRTRLSPLGLRPFCLTRRTPNNGPSRSVAVWSAARRDRGVGHSTAGWNAKSHPIRMHLERYQFHRLLTAKSTGPL
jgi:hypothetical protein